MLNLARRSDVHGPRYSSEARMRKKIHDVSPGGSARNAPLLENSKWTPYHDPCRGHVSDSGQCQISFAPLPLLFIGVDILSGGNA